MIAAGFSAIMRAASPASSRFGQRAPSGPESGVARKLDFVVGERFHQFDGLGEFVPGGRGTVKGFVDGCWAGDVELYFGQRVQADEAFEQGGIPSVRLYADREAALGELLHQFDEVIFRRRALGKVEAGNPAVQQVAARDRASRACPDSR